MQTLTAMACEDGLLTASTHGKVTLTPAQQKVADDLLQGMVAADVCLLRAGVGMGKTTLLRWLQARVDGVFVGARQFMALLKEHSPMALEETFMDVLYRAFDKADCVLVDDLHLVADVVQGYEYARRNLIHAALSAVLADAEARNKKLIFATSGEDDPTPLRDRAIVWELEEFEPEDFAGICRAWLPESEKIDFEKIHRFAPTLSGHQLKNACLWLKQSAVGTDTEVLIEYLRSRNFSSNVDLEEVESVSFKDLKGADDLIEELEARIALPFENDGLSAALGLKPKRGVLLAGPPGTGKTTSGRALAHRLKGKFFLIDGTVNAGSCDFYERVSKVSKRRNVTRLR